MSRNGIESVQIILRCDFGHTDTWTLEGELANGGNAYCSLCDHKTGTWRGITFAAYDDSKGGQQ